MYPKPDFPINDSPFPHSPRPPLLCLCRRLAAPLLLPLPLSLFLPPSPLSSGSDSVPASHAVPAWLLLRRSRRRHPFSPAVAAAVPALVNGDIWAVAIENAIGRLLNAFIVTDHKDSLLLRQCAKEANYQHLQIIIYDFDRPKLNIPRHMLPQTDHPTVLSVLRTNNPTIVNVLVDQVPLFLLVLFLSAMLPNESGSLIKGYT
ncbi:hypothetical protein ACLOJK_003524 [Asimina triloba]